MHVSSVREWSCDHSQVFLYGTDISSVMELSMDVSVQVPLGLRTYSSDNVLVTKGYISVQAGFRRPNGVNIIYRT